jgi:hypothetical protein
MPNGDEELTLDRQASTDAIEIDVPAGDDLHIVIHEEPPRFNLSVAWGDFEPLFSDVATVKGRQERMQAIGFYYGRCDDDEGPVTRRCSRHLHEELDHLAGHTLTDDEFAEQVRNRVKAIVRKTDGTIVHEPDFTHDARLVFPGSFCFTDDTQLDNPLTRARFNAEAAMWADNQALGKIPILATVRSADTNQPAADVKVVFELIAPYDTPEHGRNYLSSLSAHTEKTRAPRTYVRSKIPAVAHVVYGFNCPASKGGKTPADANGALFASGAITGFPYRASTDGRPNNFSVTATTDSNGVTGVVFLPSRMAGDVYKIKVRVLVDGRESLPSETVTSGLLQVWRNLRLARIVIKEPQGTFTGAPPIDPAMTGALGTIHPTVMRTEFQKAFHYLEVDRRARTPMHMTAASYRNAIQFAKRAVANPQNYDLDALVKEDINSPFLIWIDSDANYNANKSASARTLDLSVPGGWQDIRLLIQGLIEKFLIYWNGGSLPGVTIIRSEVGDSYSYWRRSGKPRGWNQTTSGVALKSRGCFVWYPDSIYQGNMPYGVTQNTMHEMGHVLHLRHHYTSGTLGSESGAFTANHDADDWCLMGYLPLTTNDYCGKCLLKLRGWDETAI